MVLPVMVASLMVARGGVESWLVQLLLPSLLLLLLPGGHDWASFVEGELMVMTGWC